MSAPIAQEAPRRPARRLRAGAGVATALLLAVVLTSLAAPLLPLPDPALMIPAESLAAPTAHWQTVDLERLSREHPLATRLREACFGQEALVGVLGRDHQGRDLLARLVWGGRVSLLVGALATLVSALIGVAWGVLAGWLGGRVDGLLMRTVDVLDAVPILFLVILLLGVLRGIDPAQAPDRLVVLCVVIGVASWLTTARIVRGQVRALRRREFVEAAQALGAGPLHIVRRHVLPHLTGLVVVCLTLTVPRVMLFEAFLSFLGLGVEAPGVSWGLLASLGMEQLTVVGTAWWLVLFPGLALALTLGALNLLGDAVRDALDPRLRHR